MNLLRPVLLFSLACPLAVFAAEPEVPVGVVMAPPAHLKIPDFYSKFISAKGYPIVASSKVNDYALKEAAYLVNLMLAHREDVRQAMIQSGSRMCILSYTEFTTDQPEFKRLKPKDYWDSRARGLGGSETDPYCSCAEENLLGYPGDPYAAENILIHEFAHHIHLRGVIKLDPTFDKRLQAAYDGAMVKGLWKGKYAATNSREYFAEGVQSWFDNNRENDNDHNHVNTRAELLEYDPGLAALCAEVFGETKLVYTKPATRLTGHMEGYDPSKAPKFVWPENLKKAKAESAAKHEAGKLFPAYSGHQKRQLEGWTVYVSDELREKQSEATDKALVLLAKQLKEINEVVPKVAVAKLQEVPLWFTPGYPGIGPRAEYHPSGDWLKNNNRNPAMAKGVEFTNIPNFEAETRRMPNFALHELAHAYHDRFLPKGFGNPEVKAAYEWAAASTLYDKAEHRDGKGGVRIKKAYAMTNPQEYFAETTEAFFSTNDIQPFIRAELEKQDPGAVAMLKKLWGVE